MNVSQQVFDQLCSELQQNDQFLPQVEVDSDQQEIPDKLQQDTLSKGQHDRRTTRSGKTYLAACLRARAPNAT